MIRVFILKDKKTCVNVDNDTDAQNLIDNGAFEIQDLSVFNGHENLVSAENTVVNSDGVSVTFSYPEDELALAQSEKELSETESQINDIKDRLLYAILLDDTEIVEQLKTEYKELVND